MILNFKKINAKSNKKELLNLFNHNIATNYILLTLNLPTTSSYIPHFIDRA